MPRWQNPVNAPDLRSGVLRDMGVQISLSASIFTGALSYAKIVKEHRVTLLLWFIPVL